MRRSPLLGLPVLLVLAAIGARGGGGGGGGRPLVLEVRVRQPRSWAMP